jgi:prolipoprotein diacylglyceryl transferase
MNLLTIVWNPSEGLDLGFFMVRYYSLMFVVAFGLGWYIMKNIFENENESIEKLDSLFIWTVLATLLGARLGHVIFYQPELFSQDPLSVFLPIRTQPTIQFTGFSGLASHGAAIAIVIFMFYFSKKVMKRPVLWILDRIVIPVASGAIFVRLGNFFNSEIYGHETTSTNFYAVKFVREDEFWAGRNVQQITGIPNQNAAFHALEDNGQYSAVLAAIPFRHPSQLYEAFGYIFVFALLFYGYWKTDMKEKQGLLFGLFLVLLFTVRFIVEFVKESQGGFESALGLLSTGQWLSIPFVLIGLYFVVKAKKVTYL